jgi:hypothetical protein
MERELASIAKFMLNAAGNPGALFEEVKQGAPIPSIYFPTPEMGTGGETFKTYRVEYAWYLVFFHRSTREAHEMALSVLTAIKGGRNIVHLVDIKGSATRETIRLGEPSIKPIDTGAVQLTVTFISRRPYNAAEVHKAMDFLAAIYNKADGSYLTERILEGG